MTALGTAGAARVLVALVAAALCGHPLLGVSATLNFVLNSNAIKNLPRPLGGAAGHPGSAVSAAPGIPFEGGSKYQTIDNHQVRRVLGIGNTAILNGSHLGTRAQNGLCKSSSRCVWRLPLGAVSGNSFWRGGLKGTVRSPGVWYWVPKCLTLSRPRSRSRIRALRTRSAAQTSTARVPPAEPVRKSASPVGSSENAACVTLCAALGITAKTVSRAALLRTQTVLCLRAYSWDNALSWEHFGTTLPMGVQRARIPRKDFRLVFNLGAKISTEVLELLISLCAPRLLKRASYLRVDISIRICLERLDSTWEWRWSGRWNLQRLQGNQNGHLVACLIFLTVLLTALPDSLFQDLRSSCCYFERFICADHSLRRSWCPHILASPSLSASTSCYLKISTPPPNHRSTKF